VLKPPPLTHLVSSSGEEPLAERQQGNNLHTFEDSCKSSAQKEAKIVETTGFARRVEIDASHVSMNSVGLLMHEKKYSKYIFIGVSPTYFRPTWLSTASTI
ncbi:hypothetical protein SHY38_10835, partial [Bifidobacterium breve]|uniref:hypothetical protein n=1 Tax=Bifidobacterium breve TaxID=1685 RepID=UPI0029C1EAAE